VRDPAAADVRRRGSTAGVRRGGENDVRPQAARRISRITEDEPATAGSELESCGIGHQQSIGAAPEDPRRLFARAQQRKLHHRLGVVGRLARQSAVGNRQLNARRVVSGMTLGAGVADQLWWVLRQFSPRLRPCRNAAAPARCNTAGQGNLSASLHARPASPRGRSRRGLPRISRTLAAVETLLAWIEPRVQSGSRLPYF
jgi:hypothetical protein